MPSVNPGPAVQQTINSQYATPQLIGIVDGSNAAAGFVGEFITATVAPGTVSLSNATAANTASILLSPGDWYVSGVANYTPTATTSLTAIAHGASIVSATIPAQDSFIQETFPAQVPVLTVPITKSIPTVRINITVATTVFMVLRANFTASTLTGGGTIQAIRAR